MVIISISKALELCLEAALHLCLLDKCQRLGHLVAIF